MNIDKLYNVENNYKENYTRLLAVYNRIHDLIIKYYKSVNRYYIKKLMNNSFIL